MILAGIATERREGTRTHHMSLKTNARKWRHLVVIEPKTKPKEKGVLQVGTKSALSRNAEAWMTGNLSWKSHEAGSDELRPREPGVKCAGLRKLNKHSEVEGRGSGENRATHRSVNNYPLLISRLMVRVVFHLYMAPPHQETIPSRM